MYHLWVGDFSCFWTLVMEFCLSVCERDYGPCCLGGSRVDDWGDFWIPFSVNDAVTYGETKKDTY